MFMLGALVVNSPSVGGAAERSAVETVLIGEPLRFDGESRASAMPAGV